MERSAYNLLREGAKDGRVKAVLRERYGVKNARWCQSAINQASAVMEAQEEGIRFRIEQCREKVRNTKEKMTRLSNPLKVQGCEAKLLRLQARIDELELQLKERSYPSMTFGSSKLLHQLSIATGERRDELLREWKDRRSDHLFSVGQANQKGNGNTRLSYDKEGDSFQLELRNWYPEDFSVGVRVPEYGQDALERMVSKAESVKVGEHGELVEGKEGLPYSVRVIRSAEGYQVLVSFELKEPIVEWSGRIAGIDINPEGIACTIVSKDGNLVATKFFRDSRLITASKNKRKWVLEDIVNRMLRWCRDTHGCNAVAVEELKFKGAYDFLPRTNFKLSNFMKRKMLERIRLSALKMGMLSVEVNPAYTSLAAMSKYGKRFGGFNRHQLAAFVIARRALGYGEAPVLDCLPKTRRERTMWNHCVRYYGYQPRIQTLPHHEPMERKSDGDVNGKREITELLTAPPADTSGRGSSHAPMIIATFSRRAGRVRPNRHTNGGDGARGHRVSPPPSMGGVASLPSCDTEDT